MVLHNQETGVRRPGCARNKDEDPWLYGTPGARGTLAGCHGAPNARQTNDEIAVRDSPTPPTTNPKVSMRIPKQIRMPQTPMTKTPAAIRQLRHSI